MVILNVCVTVDIHRNIFHSLTLTKAAFLSHQTVALLSSRLCTWPFHNRNPSFTNDANSNSSHCVCNWLLVDGFYRWWVTNLHCYIFQLAIYAHFTLITQFWLVSRTDLSVIYRSSVDSFTIELNWVSINTE